MIMNGCKKYREVLVFIVLLISFFSVSFCYGQQDREVQQAERDQQMQEKVTAAEQDLDAKLKPVLDRINTGDAIADEDITILKDILKSNLPYVLRMQPQSQSKFYVLSAWTNYYANENQKALQDSLKALKADSGYADARATVAAMALINRDYASLTALKGFYQKKERPQQPRENRRTNSSEPQMKSGGMPSTMPGTMPSIGPMPTPDAPVSDSSTSISEGALKINVESLIFEILGKPSATDKVVCLNNENLDIAAKGRFYNILLWMTNYLDAAKANQKSSLFNGGNNEISSQNNQAVGEGTPEFVAFKELYRNSASIEDISFVAANIDRNPNKQAIIDFLMINSGPWANTVLFDASNVSIGKDSLLNKIKIDKPTLIIVRDNSVLYAGSVDGVLPLLIIKKQPDAASDKSAASLEPVHANSETPLQDSNEPVEQKKVEEQIAPIVQEKPQTKPKDESEVLGENIQAQDLYQLAEIHFKKGRYIGYKKCVDACREIIEKYPNTIEAQKAKEMLRQVPQDKRKLYGITNEEIGS